MSRYTLAITDELREYILSVSLREHSLLESLRIETAKMPEAKMQISPDQGQFMAMLLRLMEARMVLEIGTFTGYSALSMALALPPGGHIVACDVSDAYAKTARRYWSEAGVADRITLRLAPASETLDDLLAEGRADTFDAAFIDADKESYSSYFDLVIDKMNSGGFLIADNVLWSGKVSDTSVDDSVTKSIRDFNQKVNADSRVQNVLFPIRDGLMIMKRL